MTMTRDAAAVHTESFKVIITTKKNYNKEKLIPRVNLLLIEYHHFFYFNLANHTHTLRRGFIVVCFPFFQDANKLPSILYTD